MERTINTTGITRLLTMEGAAAYLGLEKSTLYEWVSKRKIDYVKVGRLTKFDQQQLDKWIAAHTVKARVEGSTSHGTH